MNSKVYVKGRQVNTVATNPADYSVFYNRWSGSAIFRWNPGTQQGDQLFSPDNDGILLNLLFSKDGKTIYIQGREQRSGILKADYDPVTHTITNSRPFAGAWRSDGFLDGVGEAARFSGFMNQMALDSEGNLYVADSRNNRIRKVTPDGVVSTVAGTGEAGYLDGNPKTAKFSYPTGVYVNAKDEIFVADYNNHRIRKIVVE
jgi:sugar lactone lactonase YvrE